MITTRSQLADFADDLLLAVRTHASSENSLITLPGTPGGYGTSTDGLEGFARTFLLAGFQLAGARGHDPHNYAEWYARGIAAGVDPSGPQRWLRPKEMDQAKVEAASLAVILDLTREWVWDRLTPTVQAQVVDYLAEIVGDQTYPKNNWLWFRIVVNTFLRSVGGPHSLEDIRADLGQHDSYFAGDGWYRDGQTRAYDHYVGWAMHLYPALWRNMHGAADLAAGRAATDQARLDRFLTDFVHLTGADGAPLIQGRSLVYRFATAGALWTGALTGTTAVPLGRLREAAFGNINYFRAHGVPNQRGLLDLGWFGPWPRLAQRYSGTGSAYWAAKGMLGLALPADHPVWSAPPESYAPAHLTIDAPGWAVAAASDGITRIANHGTDNAAEGDTGGDSPLYARLAYSTATAPLLDEQSWLSPVDNAITLIDAAGRRSHRSGMRPVVVATGGRPATATSASTAQAHWLTPDPAQMNHGSGLTGTSEPAGTLTTISVLREDWDVRITHVDPVAPGLTLEAGGWPLADDTGVTTDISDLTVTTASRTHGATLTGVTGAGLQAWTAARIEYRTDASPLGVHAATGVVAAPATRGWYACALRLTATPTTGAAPVVDIDATHAHVTWADGQVTTVTLPTGVQR